jgi:hypothetical protein
MIAWGLDEDLLLGQRYRFSYSLFPSFHFYVCLLLLVILSVALMNGRTRLDSTVALSLSCRCMECQIGSTSSL